MAFRLDDPDVVVTATRLKSDEPRPAATIVVAPPADAALPASLPLPAPARRKFPVATVFWTATGSLVALGLGLATTRLVESLFARAEWLGILGGALAVVAAAALVAIVARETLGFVRLATLEKLQERATEALAADDRLAAEAIVRELVRLTGAQPRLARARTAIEGHLADIIDGADLLRLAERELMGPLDEEARRLVTSAAKRVSIVTAVSPRAAVDILFVLVTALALLRRIADLYGGRPGTLGLLRLLRQVITHLAFTGGMAVGDGVIQQVLGHGVAAKLSARLGEGVLNGLLTARLGLAAIELTRPLPFAALEAPALADLAAGLIATRKGEPAIEK
jgi:putative membrane protein